VQPPVPENRTLLRYAEVRAQCPEMRPSSPPNGFRLFANSSQEIIGIRDRAQNEIWFERAQVVRQMIEAKQPGTDILRPTSSELREAGQTRRARPAATETPWVRPLTNALDRLINAALAVEQNHDSRGADESGRQIKKSNDELSEISETDLDQLLQDLQAPISSKEILAESSRTDGGKDDKNKDDKGKSELHD
jgi:hypothetical protein